MTVAALSISRENSGSIIRDRPELGTSLYSIQLKVSFSDDEVDDERRLSPKEINHTNLSMVHGEEAQDLASIYQVFVESHPDIGLFRSNTSYNLTETENGLQWIPSKKRGSIISPQGKALFLTLFSYVDAAIQKKIRCFIIPEEGEKSISMLELLLVIEDCAWIKELIRCNLECRKALFESTFHVILGGQHERYAELVHYLRRLNEANQNIAFLQEHADANALIRSAHEALKICGEALSDFSYLKSDPLRVIRLNNTAKAANGNEHPFLTPEEQTQAAKEYEAKNVCATFKIISTAYERRCDGPVRKCTEDLRQFMENIAKVVNRSVRTNVPLIDDPTIQTLKTRQINWPKLESLINDYAIKLRNISAKQ